MSPSGYFCSLSDVEMNEAFVKSLLFTAVCQSRSCCHTFLSLHFLSWMHIWCMGDVNFRVRVWRATVFCKWRYVSLCVFSISSVSVASVKVEFKIIQLFQTNTLPEAAACRCVDQWYEPDSVCLCRLEWRKAEQTNMEQRQWYRTKVCAPETRQFNITANIWKIGIKCRNCESEQVWSRHRN